MYPNWNYWNWNNWIWKIWKKAIFSRAKRTTAKPFLSQANLVQRREKQIGSPGLRFEGMQIRQNTRTHTLKMHFPLQGRFLSLLKREVAMYVGGCKCAQRSLRAKNRGYGTLCTPKQISCHFGHKGKLYGKSHFYR